MYAQREMPGYLMITLGSCVALQFRVAVVPLMTRWSTGGTEMTVRPVKYPTKKEEKQTLKKRRKKNDTDGNFHTLQC